MELLAESVTLSIHGDVVACDLEESVAILNQTTGTFYTLDEVGKFIWRHLEQRTTIRSLRDAVVTAYDCDPATAANDIQMLVEDLHTARLIELN